MSNSNYKRNQAIMNQFIKELKELPEEFDNISEELLNETVLVAEVYAKDLTPSITGDAKAKWGSQKAYRVTNGFRARLY